MSKSIDIIGVQMDLGASKRGVDMGPSAIRHTNIYTDLDGMGINWRDLGDIIPVPTGNGHNNMKNYEQIVGANEKLFNSVYDSLQSGRMPVVLGGDHSISAGSIPAVLKHYGEIGLIWMDAHGDYNNEITSPSGNMHGMPFSAVTGMGPMQMIPFFDKYVTRSKCVQIAARDIDSSERAKMKESGITVFSISDIDKLGMSKVMERAIEIVSKDTRGVHLSFDIDAVTPEAAPGVGTPVHSGLTVRESFLAVEMLCEWGGITSMDMVEVNPILDVVNKTGILASELILALLGKSVY